VSGVVTMRGERLVDVLLVPPRSPADAVEPLGVGDGEAGSFHLSLALEHAQPLLDVRPPCWVVQLLLGQLRSLHDQGAELCPLQQR
jgi:hypothetical protein